MENSNSENIIKKKLRIGYAVTGSFCTHRASLDAMEKLAKIYEIVPILSFNAASMNTRFGRSEELIAAVREISGNDPILTVEDAEPLGPKYPLDALVICPCTGNTLAKLAHAVTDTPVTMAAKAHMRCGCADGGGGRLIIALATNDAMGANLSNIGTMLARKGVYFVPMVQDDVVRKPYSLVADMRLLPDSVASALDGIQLRPLFL